MLAFPSTIKTKPGFAQMRSYRSWGISLRSFCETSKTIKLIIDVIPGNNFFNRFCFRYNSSKILSLVIDLGMLCSKFEERSKNSSLCFRRAIEAGIDVSWLDDKSICASFFLVPVWGVRERVSCGERVWECERECECECECECEYKSERESGSVRVCEWVSASVRVSVRVRWERKCWLAYTIPLCSSYKYTGYRERGGSSLYFYPQGTIDLSSTESKGSHLLSGFNADSLCKFANQ